MLARFHNLSGYGNSGNFASALPNLLYGQGIGNIRCRVASHQDQIGPQSGSDTATIAQIEAPGRVGCGGAQGFDRREPSSHQLLQFAVKAGAVSKAAEAGGRHGRVRACEYSRSRRVLSTRRLQSLKILGDC
jgi:hypothetical protein